MRAIGYLLVVLGMLLFAGDAQTIGIDIAGDTLYIYCADKGTPEETPEQRLILCEIFTESILVDTLGAEAPFFSETTHPSVSSGKGSPGYWGYLQEIYTYATVLDTVDVGTYFEVVPARASLQSLRYSLDQMSGSKSLWSVSRTADILGVLPDTLEITPGDTIIVPADTTIVEEDTTITTETVTIIPPDTTHRGFLFSEEALLLRLGTAKMRLDSLSIIPEKPFLRR